MRVFSAIIGFFMLSVPSVILAAGPPICTFDGNGRVTNVDRGGSNDFCRLSATEFKINLKYAGICTSAPTEVNYRSVCTAIYDNTSGRDVEVTTSSSLPLEDGISLTEGSYTHAWILVGIPYTIRHLQNLHRIELVRAGLDLTVGRWTEILLQVQEQCLIHHQEQIG